MTNLNEALAKAKAWLASLTPAEREAHFEEQKKSWVRGEMSMRESSVVARHTDAR